MSTIKQILHVGQIVNVRINGVHCASCKEIILATATVKGNTRGACVRSKKGVMLGDITIPENCTACGAPKPFLYTEELQATNI